MKTPLQVASIIILCILMVAGSGSAQVPQTINYQGSLEQAANGTPVNGTVQMTFSLYKTQTGGSPKWSETHSAVTVEDGIYSVILGAITPLDTLVFDKLYYLELSIDGEMLTPRQPLTSVPYALKAAGLINVTVKDGKVGIGVTEPEEELHVYKDAKIFRHLFLGGFIKGEADNGLAIYPNTDAWNSRAWLLLRGGDDTRIGEADLAGTDVNLRYGSTTEGYGTIGI